MHILLIEDNPDDAELIQVILQEGSAPKFVVEWVNCLSQAADRVIQGGIDVVLSDLSLPDSQGIEAFDRLHTIAPNLPLVVLTGHDDERMAKEVLEKGGQDYLVKGQFDRPHLVNSLRHAIQRQQLLAESARYAQELRASENNLQTIVKANVDGMVIVDHQGIIRFLNPAAETLLERPFATLLGTLFGFPTQSEKKSEVEIVNSTGMKRVLEIFVVPITWEGTWATLATLRDMTDHKEMERALTQQAEELARSNQEFEQFAYVASHDLQEPLRKILVFGDRLQTACGGIITDQARDYLKRMRQASERMQTLIRDLLIFSRAGSGEQVGEPTHLNTVIQEVVEDLEITLTENGGRVEYGTLPSIEANPLLMRQLFQNLISNALKFCTPGVPPLVKIFGHPLEEDGPSFFNPDEAHEWWQIVVEDNGIGFEDEYKEKIFGMFQRLHGRSEYEGTGIGLAVCRKIVEGLGGSITAQGISGEGTQFFLRLPSLRPQNEGRSNENQVRNQFYPSPCPHPNTLEESSGEPMAYTK